MNILVQNLELKKGENHLLVIGINKYKDGNIPNLRNARKDTEAISQVLQETYGFDGNYSRVLYDEEATQERIIDIFENLTIKIQEDDNLLIYFAGHGFYNKNTKIGYLMPTDATWGKPHTYISHTTLLDYIHAINSRHTFLVLDSCFSGALFRNVTDSSNRAADNLERLPSRWALAAGLIEVVSDGFYNDNSPFAKSLLAFLKTAPSIFLASELIQHVKKAVPDNADQQPHGGILRKVGDQQGEMVFRRVINEIRDSEKEQNQVENSYNLEAQFIENYKITKRELEILCLIVNEMSNKEISFKLNISDQTVAVHRKNIYYKLKINNTAGLSKIAHDYKLI